MMNKGLHSHNIDPRDVSNVKRRVPVGTLISAAVVILIGLKLLYLVATNPNFEWHTVFEYLFNDAVMGGLQMTLVLSCIAMVIGIVIGLFLAIAKVSQNPVLRYVSSIYIWLFRGTPLLVQLLFWYNLSSLFPNLSLAIPLGPTLFSWNTNDVITPLTAALAGLALNEAAYMAEIIRGGLISVDDKQFETAHSFGMSKARVYRRIIIPQAMKSIVPPTSNQLINMVKATSMVSMIAMGDLLYEVQNIYNSNFKVIPLLMVAVLWYLFITSILSVVQNSIENYYNRSERYSSQPGWLSRLLSTIGLGAASSPSKPNTTDQGVVHE
ncbi:ABC transporter permease subunit [Vibrio sp. CAIM 722]|uniref:Glutamate/aspartate import permease protein GltK n=1 Tax=Vibrio eleionomae TaxID=2653505 RepID=A0A7X4LH60_9VIBR|nr:amino acid ABC transporter permease [Vibrio eleionomae]MZI91859.1 ABC transporter permease subunit [Vibrio eleionomae]